MSTKRRGIDHVVVLAHDMSGALSNYARLGFQITPRMQHPFGTANNLIMFGETFLEILGVDRPELVSGIGAIIAGLLREKEGVSHFALQSDDAIADREEFLAKGFAASPVSGFEREVTLPDGRRLNAVVSVCTIANPNTPRVLLFVSQQHVKEAIWAPEWQRHDNGARDLTSVTIVSDDPARDFKVDFERLYGAENVLAEDGAVVAHTNCGRLEVLTSARFAARFEGADIPMEPVLPYVAATSVRVDELARVADLARRNGIVLKRLGSGALLAEPQHANGVAIEFHET